MEIKINSYSSQSSLISSLICFIVGGIFFTNAETVLNFTSIAIGIVLGLVGIFTLVLFYINHKKGITLKRNLFIGAAAIILAILFLVKQDITETLLGLTVGGWIMLVGVLRLISALRLEIKTKKFLINFIISLILIGLGIYTIASGRILLESAGVLMMVSSGLEIIGYIINSRLDSKNPTVEEEKEESKEVILTLPDLEDLKKEEEPVVEEEVKLIPEDTKPKKRRGRKKKTTKVKDVKTK